jgi:hypothetical protein
MRWSLRRPEIDITLPGYPARFTIRRSSSDIHVFSSIFLHGAPEEFLPEDPRFILDGGANVGYTRAFHAHPYPDATIIAAEPSGETFLTRPTVHRKSAARPPSYPPDDLLSPAAGFS